VRGAQIKIAALAAMMIFLHLIFIATRKGLDLEHLTECKVASPWRSPQIPALRIVRSLLLAA
jgi:hypothetical protein